MRDGNLLFYGDNLEILRGRDQDGSRYIDDESVDLIYLDPLFKSNQDYNVLFAEKSGERSAAQIRAFEDTWHWDMGAEEAFREIVEAGGKVSDAMRAFRTFLGENDMMAYLAMMAPRLIELRRVLKPTGSIYLHCDPTASHYLKMLMDAVLGPQHFLNEVIWKRTSAHSSAKRYGPTHDVLLFFSRTAEVKWIGGFQKYNGDYVGERFKRGGDRPWKDADLTGSGVRHGETGEMWRGFDVTAKGRHWAYPPRELDELDRQGRIYWPSKKGGWPRFRRYLDETEGVPLQDVWTDIFPVNSQAQERLGYPTQKPEALLERVINASSNPGDTIRDPFCGCGTTVSAAQKLGRRWIGIDVTFLSIGLVTKRLAHAYGLERGRDYQTIGEPTDIEGARALAAENRYQFQWWILDRLNARPEQQKKGRDRGIDGKLLFHDEVEGGETKEILISVKSGGTGSGDLRDLIGTVERDKAAIGVFVSLQKPTRDMRADAAKAGVYRSPGWQKDYPRIQILTVEEILEGRDIDYPPSKQVNVTHKKAPKAEPVRPSAPGLFGSGSGPAEKKSRKKAVKR